MFRWQDSLVSCVDGTQDGGLIHVKNIYKCAFKNIRICVDGAFHDSVTTNITRIISFFFSLMFNSVKFRSLNLHEKAKFWRILKRAVFTIASFYSFRFLQGFAFFCKLGLLLFKPQGDYQVVVKKSDRVNSQLGPVAPVALRAVQKWPLWTAALLFSSKVSNFVCSYCFPNQYPEVFQEPQGRPLYEKKSLRVEESLAYPSYPGRANISS